MRQNEMLGFYDYTVWLTYMSAFFAVYGTFVGINGGGHPYIAAICLIICGVLDGFDGRVARSKKNRTAEEKAFGIQIDSLSDMLAFGVLPCAMNYALGSDMKESKEWYLFFFLCAVFVLSTLIRLAHFNVMEEMRQKEEEGNRKYFNGLPVTTSAFVFPFLAVIQYFFGHAVRVFPICICMMIIMPVLFLFKGLRLPKLTGKAIDRLAMIGMLEVVIVILLMWKRAFHA